MPESHARDICQELIKRKIKVTWGAWLTPRDVTEEFLLLMREAGCRHIGYSPDAVTDRGLEVLQKGFSAADVERTIQLSKKLKDVAVGYGYFCAYPGMTMFETLKTLFMFFRIPLVLPGRGSLMLGWIRIEPYTKIFSTAVKEGVLPQNIKMLPENEEDLARLFYVPRSQWLQTLIFDVVLDLVNKVLKPLAKGVFRVAGRLRGRKTFYDS
jgi:hypothetical protein